jgi:hypothetical protein
MPPFPSLLLTDRSVRAVRAVIAVTAVTAVTAAIDTERRLRP